MGYENNNRRRDSGSGRSGGFNKGRSGGNRSFNNGPREMHKTTCGDCGKECEVPFKPSGERPVYCNDCFAKHKPARKF